MTQTASGRGFVGKTAVGGAIQRGGNTLAEPIPGVTHKELMRFLTRNVQPGTEMFTDEHRSYAGLELEYEHAAVSCSAGEYVRGPVHTNSVESFWSMFKRDMLRHLVQNERQTPSMIRQRIRRPKEPEAKTTLEQMRHLFRQLIDKQLTT